MSPETGAAIELGRERVSLDDLVRVARGGAPVRFAPEAVARMVAARKVVERIAREGIPSYGVTTGLGAAVDTKLDGARLAEFQRNAVVARVVGVGPPFDRIGARAAMFARAAGLAQGGAGISPAVADHLLACLNADVTPVMASIGSLGAADLAPLAALAEMMLGEGEAIFGGRLMPAAEALAAAGLTPVTLAAKDGIAIFNANAANVGLAAIAADAAMRLQAFWLATVATGFEAFRANPSPLDARALKARPQPGQADVAACLRALLAGGSLFEPGAPRRLQDPLCFRDVAQVFGAFDDAVAALVGAVETELNGAGDNPLVLPEHDASFSAANFDVTHLALKLEGAALALALVAQTSFARIRKLTSPQFSDLPRFLAPEGGHRNGYATPQKTAAALEARIRQAAMPVATGVGWVADGVEDYMPNAMQAAQKFMAAVEDAARLAAIEAMVAADALDLRQPKRTGDGVRRFMDGFRSHVPALDRDRALGREFEALARALLDDGWPAALARQVTP